MTISKRIRSQLFTSSSAAAEATADAMLIRLPLHRPLPGSRKRPSRAKKCRQQEQPQGLGWSDEEHERFLRGLEKFPTGPWKEVAAFVATRTTRQVMTHAQKYRQKIERRQRGLQTQASRKPAAASITPLAGVDEAMSTTSETSAIAPVHVKTESVDLSTRHTTTACVGAADSLMTAASSPSSTDLAICDFGFCLFSANHAFEGSHYTTTSSVMTADEFRAATDELFAEPLYVNAFDDHQLLLPQDDPLTLMFQDPSTFSGQYKQSLAMDVVYPPASMWTSVHSSMLEHAEASSYLCQL